MEVKKHPGSVNWLGGDTGLASVSAQVLKLGLIKLKSQKKAVVGAPVLNLLPRTRPPQNTGKLSKVLPAQSPSGFPLPQTSRSPCVALDRVTFKPQPDFPVLGSFFWLEVKRSNFLATEGNIPCQHLAPSHPQECSGFQQSSLKW